MKITKIEQGKYKVVDNKGTWIAKGGVATINGYWTAFECSAVEECSNLNNWGVQFKTFKQLKEYSQQ